MNTRTINTGERQHKDYIIYMHRINWRIKKEQATARHFLDSASSFFSALTLLGGEQEGHPGCTNLLQLIPSTHESLLQPSFDSQSLRHGTGKQYLTQLHKHQKLKD